MVATFPPLAVPRILAPASAPALAPDGVGRILPPVIASSSRMFAASDLARVRRVLRRVLVKDPGRCAAGKRVAGGWLVAMVLPPPRVASAPGFMPFGLATVLALGAAAILVVCVARLPPLAVRSRPPRAVAPVPALANRPALSREYFLATKKPSQRVLTELSAVLRRCYGFLIVPANLGPLITL